MLEKYRQQIDEIDKKIIELLAQRLEVVKKIWEYKKEHNIAPLQKSRWEQVLKSRKKIATELWVNENLIEDIWNLIHKEALRLEK